MEYDLNRKGLKIGRKAGFKRSACCELKCQLFQMKEWKKIIKLNAVHMKGNRAF